MAVILTNENFQSEVLNSEIPVLVDFYADWCGPCKMLAPIINELSDEYAGKVKVCKINVDEQGETAAKYGIQSIPTVMLFKNGEPVETMMGFRPKDAFKAMLDK